MADRKRDGIQAFPRLGPLTGPCYRAILGNPAGIPRRNVVATGDARAARVEPNHNARDLGDRIKRPIKPKENRYSIEWIDGRDMIAAHSKTPNAA